MSIKEEYANIIANCLFESITQTATVKQRKYLAKGKTKTNVGDGNDVILQLKTVKRFMCRYFDEIFV